MVAAVFTGLYRHNDQITNLTLGQRLARLRKNGIEDIYWYVWEGHTNEELRSNGVKVIEIPEPYPHERGIAGRQRQIYNTEQALKDFSDDEIILKLRWDIDFNDALVQNVTTEGYFEGVQNGIIEHKVWSGFYSIQEMFSPADVSFAGYRKDLNTLINHEYKINEVSANNYISHDGMMLMPRFIEANTEVCDLIRLDAPDPWTLMYKEEHLQDPRYLNAWAYSYYVLHKYFKTGPLGSSYFKRGDQARWPFSFVDYNRFKYNYDTVTGLAPKEGLYPKYRVYDDIFIERLVTGAYKDPFGQALYSEILNSKSTWEAMGI